jgi:hypothetical protein
MQLERLRDGLSLDGRVVELPFLFSETVGEPELERLADTLDSRL